VLCQRLETPSPPPAARALIRARAHARRNPTPLRPLPASTSPSSEPRRCWMALRRACCRCCRRRPWHCRALFDTRASCSLGGRAAAHSARCMCAGCLPWRTQGGAHAPDADSRRALPWTHTCDAADGLPPRCNPVCPASPQPSNCRDDMGPGPGVAFTGERGGPLPLPRREPLSGAEAGRGSMHARMAARHGSGGRHAMGGLGGKTGAAPPAARVACKRHA
jgi:hypothetical protein